MSEVLKAKATTPNSICYLFSHCFFDFFRRPTIFQRLLICCACAAKRIYALPPKIGCGHRASLALKSASAAKANCAETFKECTFFRCLFFNGFAENGLPGEANEEVGELYEFTESRQRHNELALKTVYSRE